MDSIETKVKIILEEVKEARDSDRILMDIYYRATLPNYETMSAQDLILGDFGQTSFESIRRARQKVQAKYPVLASNRKVRWMRKIKEEEYREWATK